MSVLSYFFFFKQKTAYEMRISDWSSDVCSSDLGGRAGRSSQLCPSGRGDGANREDGARLCRDRATRVCRADRGRRGAARRHPARADERGDRSEEHTSELQSLMRTSYAVFCLKKKKHDRKPHRRRRHTSEQRAKQ